MSTGMSLKQKRESRALGHFIGFWQVGCMQGYDAFGKVRRDSHALIVLMHAANDEASARNICSVDPSFTAALLPSSHLVSYPKRDTVAVDDDFGIVKWEYDLLELGIFCSG